MREGKHTGVGYRYTQELRGNEVKDLCACEVAHQKPEDKQQCQKNKDCNYGDNDQRHYDYGGELGGS